MTMAVAVSGLRKSYRGQVVLGGLDFEIPWGMTFALLGPNGAGKTTTVRILSTLIRFDGGSVRVAGHDVAKEPAEVRRNIGVTGQFSAIDDLLTGYENLSLMADLSHLERVPGRKRAGELLEQFDLVEAAGKPASTYSGGMRRRLDLAMTLIGRPRLIFLDEPTTGLDPQARANLWEHIRGLRDRGATIFLTTHYLDEADALCDRILVIDHGKIVASGTPENLKQQVSGDAVRLSLADNSQAPTVMKIVQELDGAVEVETDADVVGFRIPRGGSVLPGLLRSIDAQGIELHGVEVHRPTLDDVFLTMTGRSLRDEDTPAPTEKKEEVVA